MTGLAHILERVEPDLNSGCWLWPGATARRGYGVAKIGGRTRTIHRAVFEMHHGPLRPGTQVCHRCDTPQCVNLNHLFAGTCRDNANDRQSKGRGNQARGEASGPSILTEKQAREIVLRLSAGEPGVSIARAYGVAANTIYSIKSGQSWAHIERPKP